MRSNYEICPQTQTQTHSRADQWWTQWLWTIHNPDFDIQTARKIHILNLTSSGTFYITVYGQKKMQLIVLQKGSIVLCIYIVYIPGMSGSVSCQILPHKYYSWSKIFQYELLLGKHISYKEPLSANQCLCVLDITYFQWSFLSQ